MPIPDLSLFCVRIAPQGRLCITMPGGSEMCVPWTNGRVPDPYEYSLAALGAINSALQPLIPFFDVLDVLIAIHDCVKAVEKALGPPPDPSKLIQCFPKLAKALGKLLKLIPQLSIPVMVGNLLDVTILFLTGLETQLLTVLRKQLRLLRAATYAAKIGSVQLQVAVDCANADLSAHLANMNKDAEATARLFVLINALLELAGMDPLPSITDLGTDAAKALKPIDALIEILTTARRALP